MYFYFGALPATCGSGGYVGSAALSGGVAEVDRQILGTAGSYTLTACFAGSNPYSDSSDTENVDVLREDATVTAGAGNLDAYQATSGSASFTLTFTVRETNPEPDVNAGALPGSIGTAGLTVNLIAVGDGSNNQTVACTGAPIVPTPAYSDVRTFTCAFTSVAVDAYEVAATVTGSTYRGDLSEILAVYESSADFVTGGGKFLYPGTDDRVNFGLVYRFTGKGKTNPRGNLLVMRHLSNGDVCRAKSNDVGAPSISGATASFAGKGNYLCTQPDGTTYDGGGNKTITGWAEDNGEPGSGPAPSPDRFWVNVVTPNSQLLMPKPAATNAAPLTGGNIQVPQKGGRK